MPGQESTSEKKRTRVTPADRRAELLPWRRASELTTCFLYWAPASVFPVPLEQKQWLTKFLERFFAKIVKPLGLRSEVFLQMKTLYPDLIDDFTMHCTDLTPLAGLLRRPGAAMQKAPDEEAIRAILEGRKKYKFDDYMPDLAYWFVKKAEKMYREMFFGYGGMTIVYMKPDPNAVGPPLNIPKKVREHPMFPKIDVDALYEQSFAMMDSFQEKSKQLFGAELESQPVYKGLRFILPLLETADFFKHSEQIRKAFELFDFYFSESPADKGFLLATKNDVEEDLCQLIHQMREEGLSYPER
jgi:hypothetical protein